MTEIITAPAYNNPRLEQLPPREVVVATDSFTRTDTAYPPVANGMGVTETGSFPWVNFSSNPPDSNAFGGAIVGGKMGIVVKSSPGSRRYGSYFRSGVSDDYKFGFRFDSGAKDTTFQMMFNMVDINNHFFLTVQSDKWMVFKREAGTGAGLIVPTGKGYASNNDYVEIKKKGALITLILNGVVIDSVNNSLFSGGDGFGLVQTFASSEVDVSVPKSLIDQISLVKYQNWS